MTRTLLLSLLFFTSTSFAADAPILREIMGKSVYEESGIVGLSDEQLQVLEKWILDNAVETRMVQKAEPPSAAAPTPTPEPATATAPRATATADDSDPTTPEPTKTIVTATQSAEPAAQAAEPVKTPPPRYIKLAEPPGADEDEPPITQKYARIDTLDEQNRGIQPDLIRSRIDGTFKGWRGKTRFRLENGDIWQQRQSATFITKLESPDVIIKKNRFNFYTMEVPAIGRKVHVKRIK